MPLSLMWSATENKEVTHERKFRTHEIPTRKNLGPTKYPRKKTGTHEIPRRKFFGPTKYPRAKILAPRNTHEQKFWAHEIPTKARWRDGTKPTRPMMTHDPRILAQSLLEVISS